jgi:hypothetical protein
MQDTWIQQKRDQANLEPSREDSEALLEKIKGWQRDAQEVASKASYHQLKKAVQEVPPNDLEAQYLFKLYALWADAIYGICVHTYRTHSHNAAADEPVVSLKDLLQESYILFQRAMVRSTTKEKMRSRLRARMAEHVRTQMTVEDDPEERTPEEATDAIAPGFDLPEIYQELVDENRVSQESAKIWRRLKPEDF